MYVAGKDGLKVAADVSEIAAPAVSTIANVVAPGSGVGIMAVAKGIETANDIVQTVDGVAHNIGDIQKAITEGYQVPM